LCILCGAVIFLVCLEGCFECFFVDENAEANEELAELGDVLGFGSAFAAFKVNHDWCIVLNDDVLEWLVHFFLVDLKNVHGAALPEEFV